MFQVINKLVIQFCRISLLERISSFYRVVQIYFGLCILIIGLLLRKDFCNLPLPFLFKWYKPKTVCWCKQPTSNSLKHLKLYIRTQLYDKSIIILLKNVLTIICSEISKILLTIWMVYVYIATFNVKRLEEVEELDRNECTLHRWPSSPVMSHCSRPYQ